MVVVVVVVVVAVVVVFRFCDVLGETEVASHRLSVLAECAVLV